MFDGLCILAALTLFWLACEVYRNIAFLVLCFFVVSEVTHTNFFLTFRSANPWFIYQLYSLINVIIIYRLYKAKAHISIVGLITLNVLLNIVVSYYLISDVLPKAIFILYPDIAGIIAVLCLVYMGAITRYGNRYLDYKNHSDHLFGRILRTCDGFFCRRIT